MYKKQWSNEIKEIIFTLISQLLVCVLNNHHQLLFLLLNLLFKPLNLSFVHFNSRNVLLLVFPNLEQVLTMNIPKAVNFLLTNLNIRSRKQEMGLFSYFQTFFSYWFLTFNSLSIKRPFMLLLMNMCKNILWNLSRLVILQRRIHFRLFLSLFSFLLFLLFGTHLSHKFY